MNSGHLDIVPPEAVAIGLAVAVAIALVAGLVLWARAVRAAYRPAREVVERLERLAAELEAAPNAGAPSRPAADYRNDAEGRLLLLEAAGRGDSPRAQALRRRLGMAAPANGDIDTPVGLA